MPSASTGRTSSGSRRVRTWPAANFPGRVGALVLGGLGYREDEREVADAYDAIARYGAMQTSSTDGAHLAHRPGQPLRVAVLPPRQAGRERIRHCMAVTLPGSADNMCEFRASELAALLTGFLADHPLA